MIILTLQEIFDKVASHLLTQNEKSMGEVCLYRGPRNLKCAIGVIIPDELYKPEFEFKSIQHLIYDFNLFPVEQLYFLKALQETHDAYRVPYWKTELINVSKKFNLSTISLTNF